VSTTQTIPSDFKSFARGFPLRENCDFKNPYETFLWMFAALPFVKGGPLIMPIDYYQFVSKHLVDLGAMMECPKCGHSQPQKLKYQPPINSNANWMTSPGKWVPVETPDRDPRSPAQQAADQLLTQQQLELFKELWSRLTPEQQRELTAPGDPE
jgi:hypothetical protein